MDDPTDINPTTWEHGAEEAAAYVDVGRMDYSEIFDGFPSKHLTMILSECIEAFAEEWWPDGGSTETEPQSALESWWGTVASYAMGFADLMGVHTYVSAADVVPLLVKKQHDYGHQNILRFGLHGLLVRVNDKVARIENLVWREEEAANESLQDSFDDLIGYSIIGIMLVRGTFLLPLSEDQ